MELYKVIKTDKHLLSVYGHILAVGNILNGGSEKQGQADGFDIRALSSAATFKSNTGKTMLQFITKRLCEQEDSTFNEHM
jgi:hypothetical protein